MSDITFIVTELWGRKADVVVEEIVTLHMPRPRNARERRWRAEMAAFAAVYGLTIHDTPEPPRAPWWRRLVG